MSLATIDERLKKMGLNDKQREEIIDMVREFGLAVVADFRKRVFG
jgi:hypothetical protein